VAEDAPIGGGLSERSGRRPAAAGPRLARRGAVGRAAGGCAAAVRRVPRWVAGVGTPGGRDGRFRAARAGLRVGRGDRGGGGGSGFAHRGRADGAALGGALPGECAAPASAAAAHRSRAAGGAGATAFGGGAHAQLRPPGGRGPAGRRAGERSAAPFSAGGREDGGFAGERRDLRRHRRVGRCCRAVLVHLLRQALRCVHSGWIGAVAPTGVEAGGRNPGREAAALARQAGGNRCTASRGSVRPGCSTGGRAAAAPIAGPRAARTGTGASPGGGPGRTAARAALGGPAGVPGVAGDGEPVALLLAARRRRTPAPTAESRTGVDRRTRARPRRTGSARTAPHVRRSPARRRDRHLGASAGGDGTGCGRPPRRPREVPRRPTATVRSGTG